MPILDHLDAMHRNTNEVFDWRLVDQNRDSIIDSMIVLHSGHQMKSTENETVREIDARAGPYTAALTEDMQWHSNAYSIHLATYSVMSVFQGDAQDLVSATGSPIRSPIIPLTSLLREMMHAFGFPDLNPRNTASQGWGTGIYSLLSMPLTLHHATTPWNNAMLDPWTRYQLGWIEPMQITANGVYESLPSALSANNSVYVISKPYPQDEYLLIEYREALLFDSHLPANGFLIWHIDDRIRGNYRAGGPFQADWPANGKHYQVRLIQADGQYDLERSFNPGDAGDYYQTNSPGLGPSNQLRVGNNDDSDNNDTNNGNIFNQSDTTTAPTTATTQQPPLIFPNTDSYSGGNMIPTGISIYNFTTTSFSISGFAYTKEEEQQIDMEGQILQEYANKCLIQVNTKLCPEIMRTYFTSRRHLENCDCYQFCGNSGIATCCPFGQACEINCPTGKFIAGCLMPNDDDIDEPPEEYTPIVDDNDNNPTDAPGVDDGDNNKDEDTDEPTTKSSGRSFGADTFIAIGMPLMIAVVMNILSQ